EKSLNTSLGFTSRIGEHFDLSLDFFQIDIDDRIALSESITGDALTDYVAANYGVSGLQSASFFVNAADTRTRGAELVSNWRQSLGNGQLL
ncbi:TonB-dependent receptor domain-containing protein, partial [Enterobacter hormaechei]